MRMEVLEENIFKPFMERILSSRKRYTKMLKSKFGRDYVKETSSSIGIYCSKTALNRLTLITLLDAFCNTQSLGSYVIVKVVSKTCFTGKFLLVLVEDHVGNLAALNLMFFPEISRDAYFPPGTVLILKEPARFLHKLIPVIYFYSPTDVIRVRENTPLAETVGLKNICWKTHLLEGSTETRTVLKWTTEGDNAFAGEKFSQALECYLSALNMAEGDPLLLQEIRLKVSSTYLELGYYESSLEHALKVENDTKSFWIAGQAYYSLRKFQEAFNQFQKLVRLDLTHAEGLTWLTKSIDRLKEEKRNITDDDLRRLLTLAEEAPNSLSDCADFMGLVRISPARNKVIVATQNINPGEIILVSKALCVITDDAGEEEEKKEIAEFNLLNKLVLLMYKNPITVGTKVYCLLQKYFGPKNVIQYCDGSDNEFIIDVDQVDELLSLGTCYSKFPHNMYAFFGYESIIKRSCIYNAAPGTCNDMLVYRSLKQIKRGEEVIITNNYRDRNRLLTMKAPVCSCEICKLDSLESSEIHANRKNLKKKLSLIVKEKRFSSLNKLVKQLEKTYSKVGRMQYRLDLTFPYLTLSRHLHTEKGFGEAIATADKALATLGLDRYTLQKCVEEAPPGPVFPKHVYVSSSILSVVSIYIHIYTAAGQMVKVSMWQAVKDSLRKLFSVDLPDEQF